MLGHTDPLIAERKKRGKGPTGLRHKKPVISEREKNGKGLYRTVPYPLIVGRENGKPS